MRVTVWFDTDNDSFDSDFAHEVRRILDKAGNKIIDSEDGKLIDSNGNVVGAILTVGN